MAPLGLITRPILPLEHQHVVPTAFLTTVGRVAKDFFSGEGKSVNEAIRTERETNKACQLVDFLRRLALLQLIQCRC